MVIINVKTGPTFGGQHTVVCVVDRELAEKFPSPETYILLGDAYMSIQEVCIC